jgi:hypothetical protein
MGCHLAQGVSQSSSLRPGIAQDDARCRQAAGLLEEAVSQARGAAQMSGEDIGVQEKAHSGTSRRVSRWRSR